MKIMKVVFVVLLGFFLAFSELHSVAFAQKEAPEAVRIGGSQPLTGALSPPGKEGKIGFEWGVEYINTVKGGVYVEEFKKKIPLKLFLYDDASDPTKVKSIFEKLIGVDKIVAAIAPFSSYLTISASVATEQYKVPLVSYAAWSDKIYERGFKYVFNTLVRSSEEGAMTMRLLRELNLTLSPPIKKIAVVYEDNPYTVDVAAGIKNNIEGFELVLFEKVPVQTMDFSSILLKIKRLEPDFIVNATPFSSAIEFVKEMKQYDVNAKAAYFPYAADHIIFKKTLGPLAEKAWGHAHYLDAKWGGEAEKALKWYKEKQKEQNLPLWPVDQAVAGAFETVLIAAEAIEKAGSLDPTKIRDAIAKIDMMFPMGPIKFDGSGVSTERSMGIVQVQDGEWVLLVPKEFKGIKLDAKKVAYPTPKWAER